MKKKIKFTKIFRAITAAIFLCFRIKTYTENTDGMTKFFIDQTVKYPGSYDLITGAETEFFEINAHLKTENPLPKFQLNLDGFSARFSPILYRERKKNIPALSFFFGSLNKAAFLNLFSAPVFTVQKPSSRGIKFFPKHFVSCSTSKKDTSCAAELSLKNFNLLLLAEKEAKIEKADIHLCAAYKIDDLTDGNISLGLAFYSSFFPDAYSKFYSESKRYNGLYSGEIIFSAETDYGEYSVLGLGSLAVPSKNSKQGLSANKIKPSIAGRIEFDFFKDYAGFDAGISLKQKDFSGVKGKTQKEVIAGFFRPKIIIDIFKLEAVYNFSKQYGKKKQDKLEYFHSGGLDLKIGNSNYIFKTGMFYENTEWDFTAKFEIRKLKFWQDIFILGTKFTFENKEKNPFIIKNYSVNSSFKINFGKDIKAGIEGELSQKNISAVKTHKINHKIKVKKSFIEWQKLKAEGGLFFEAVKELRRFEHSVKAEIKFTAEKPFYNLVLRYKIKIK
ncbi:hypothetical protein [Treponema pedis]|uniref:Uncharacterized protein n=2 Tax=Treponema pedis TaxID=409322 RepID=S6A8Q1_9SPIR|nr:hypothetical protein [Treponema pedis]AGT44219.1 hypothetical protein TPE_1745 [Treponema pedis str. T A4]